MTASITSTLSKLLNTVGTVADTATKIVDNAAAGLDMVDNYVRTAKEKQEATIAVDMDSFYETLHKETSLANAMREEALQRELQSNQNLKKHYDEEYSRLKSVIAQVKTKYRPE